MNETYNLRAVVRENITSFDSFIPWKKSITYKIKKLSFT